MKTNIQTREVHIDGPKGKKQPPPPQQQQKNYL